LCSISLSLKPRSEHWQALRRCEWFYSATPSKCWDSSLNLAKTISFHMYFNSRSTNHPNIWRLKSWALAASLNKLQVNERMATGSIPKQNWMWCSGIFTVTWIYYGWMQIIRITVAARIIISNKWIRKLRRKSKENSKFQKVRGAKEDERRVRSS
jgi:hypothetical protein